MKISDRLGVLSFAGMLAKLVAYRILPPSAARRKVKVFDLIEFIFPLESFG